MSLLVTIILILILLSITVNLHIYVNLYINLRNYFIQDKVRAIEKNRRSIFLLKKLPEVLVMFVAVSIAVYFRIHSPFPLIPGVDSIYALGYITSIVNGYFKIDMFGWPYYITQYPPTFHVLHAVVSYISSINPLELFWAEIFFLLPLFAYIMYRFLLNLFKEKVLAAIGAVISIFFHEFLMPNLFYPTPTAFLQLLALVLLLIVFSDWSKPYHFINIIFVVLCILALLLTHFSLSVIFIVILISIHILLEILNEQHNSRYVIGTISIIIWCFIMLILVFEIYITFPFKITLPQTPYANLSLSAIRWLVYASFSKFFIYMALIGALINIITFITKFSNGNGLSICIGEVNLLGLTLFLSIFLPIHCSFRILAFLRPFVAFYVVSIFYQLSKVRSLIYLQLKLNMLFINKKSLGFSFSAKSLAVLCCIVLLIFSFPEYIQPINQIKSYYMSVGVMTNIAQYEVEASKFLREYSILTGKRLLIISDPYSQDFIVSLIGRDRAFNIGGSWTPQDLLAKIYEGLIFGDAQKIREIICSVIPYNDNDYEILLIVSGRTNRWISIYPKVTDLFDDDFNMSLIENIIKNENFEVIYQQLPKIVVFKLNLRKNENDATIR
jgi:hypothetical protein